MARSVSSSDAKALDTLLASAPSDRGAREDVRRLSSAQVAGLTKAREARWRPGLVDQPFHSEIFASLDDASGAGLALALAQDALQAAELASRQRDDPFIEVEDQRHILWVQDKRAIERSGRPFLHGLPEPLRDRLIHVEAANAQDALFALEEGLRCRDLACVIGEIAGNPRALDFTASRRLSLTAEKHGVALWLVRLAAEANLSSARMRWRVEAARSARPYWNPDAPGAGAWKAELFRAAHHAPGKWTLTDDKGRLSRFHPNAANADTGGIPAYSRHLVRATVGRSLAAVARL